MMNSNGVIVDSLPTTMASSEAGGQYGRICNVADGAAQYDTQPVDPSEAMTHVLSVVNHHSSPEAKVELFRSLFRGRADVYPRRFESRKTGKSGYAPAWTWCSTPSRER
jgi:hypothetical protein